MTQRFESPRVLICGGAGGIGLACAEAFAAHGAELILTDCDGVALTRAADRLGAVARFCDAIGSASIEIFVEDLSNLFPSIDVLINAAGRGYVRSLAMAKMTRAVLPLLWRANGERWIVNIECTKAAEPDTLFPYASSPPAFRTLSRMFEDQLRGSGIKVLTIASRLGGWVPANLNGSDHVLLDRANEVDTAQRALAAVSGGRPVWGPSSAHRSRSA